MYQMQKYQAGDIFYILAIADTGYHYTGFFRWRPKLETIIHIILIKSTA